MSDFDGELLRPVTQDDQLIVDRIERFRDRAFHACESLLKKHGKHSILVDVEHLFDGQSLYFYFLGDVPDDVHRLTDQLADEYEKKVGFRKFTSALANGCGPNCGTEESKCSSGGCSTCAIRNACHTNH
ncbi:MAG: PSP1 C-terminal domain-containing protein [Planctomycetota bacterium]